MVPYYVLASKRNPERELPENTFSFCLECLPPALPIFGASFCSEAVLGTCTLAPAGSSLAERVDVLMMFGYVLFKQTIELFGGFYDFLCVFLVVLSKFKNNKVS